jgi:folate-binding protein YgfZ
MAGTELAEKLAVPGARLEEYRGAQTVAAYSGLRSEFGALSGGCGVFDLGWRAKIVLTGGDRVRWLNGMITNNVRDLASGHGVYAFLLNPQGHIQADLYAYNRGEFLLVDTDRAQVEKVSAIFDRYIIMDDVEVTNVSDTLTAIGVAGPRSREILSKAGLEVSDLELLQLRDVAWQQAGLTVARGDNLVVESYELWLSPANVSALWDALIAVGATAVGSEALECLRIASGSPRYGQDIRERDLPQETGQARALHFTKGCYVGQEIVERIHSRGAVHRKFTGFTFEGSLPPAGTKLQSGGKDVGEVTSTAVLPTGQADLNVALGYVRREAGASGTELAADGGKAVVHELPFSEVFKH